MCDTNPIKLGFVVAEFNRDITYMMEIEGREHAAFLGAEVTECIYVPGAYDMPLAIKKMLTSGKVDAVSRHRRRRPLRQPGPALHQGAPARHRPQDGRALRLEDRRPGYPQGHDLPRQLGLRLKGGVQGP